MNAAKGRKSTMTPSDKPTTIDERGMTWNQRRLFHKLVNAGMLEINALTATFCVEGI